MSPEVLDHLRHPRNVGTLDGSDPHVGIGVARTSADGGITRISIRVGENGTIEEARFQAYGCSSAIASASLATEHVARKTVAEARRFPRDGIRRTLTLPPDKAYCASLAALAVRSAVRDYEAKRDAADAADGKGFGE